MKLHSLSYSTLSVTVVAVATLLTVVALSQVPGHANSDTLPLGLPPLTEAQKPKAELITLGHKLFFDRRLSFNNTNSCAMCHIESQALTSNQSATAVGMEGQSLRRNAPSLFNVAYQKHLFHDGRESELSTQVWLPILASNEMANPSIGYLLDKLRAFKDYSGMFESAFAGEGPTMQHVGDAIAAFEKTLLSGNSRFDRWYFGGAKNELTTQEKAGFELFSGNARCTQCHAIEKSSALFTDQEFHVTGVGFYAATAPPPATWQVQLAPGVVKTVQDKLLDAVSAPRMADTGRFEVTLKSSDRWAYKTPSLRNVEHTFPYMHNGSLQTLDDVIEFYDRGGYPHDGISELQPLGLTGAQKQNLVAFLKTLTGDNVAR